jgi:pimeloyl-ACP methyl ester carboxylesterase
MQINKILVTLVAVLMLSACSSIGSNTKSSIQEQINRVAFSVPPDQQIVIIYNHGISAPQQREPCYMPYNRPPSSLRQLASDHLLVYSLCSTSVESPLPSAAGKQVYLRKQEISHAIDAFLARGILPRNLFLAGHSNGGWTSLMMARDTDKRFNGVIAFAPAFAGKRKEEKLFPWWRHKVRPKQVKDMLGAPRMDALVFAYENDPYNRPQDLQFLVQHYPLKNGHGVELVSYGCGLRNAHQTFRNDCRLLSTKAKIIQFLQKQIALAL